MELGATGGGIVCLEVLSSLGSWSITWGAVDDTAEETADGSPNNLLCSDFGTSVVEFTLEGVTSNRFSGSPGVIVSFNSALPLTDGGDVLFVSGRMRLTTSGRGMLELFKNESKK